MRLVKKPKAPLKSTAITLKVSLIGSSPLIWRRIVVPGRLHLGKLHKIIQAAMGWKTSHLHEFVIAGKRYTDPTYDNFSMDDENESLDQDKVTIVQVTEITDRFEYIYDYGDGWQHEIKIEKIEDPDPRLTLPICFGGANACPPEDCGGLGGYSEFLKNLSKQEVGNSDAAKEYDALAWVGGYFDPTSFDPNRINSDHLWRKKW